MRIPAGIEVIIRRRYGGSPCGSPGAAAKQFTTIQPGVPSGLTCSGIYHAAGAPQADPPYMRKMVFYPPPGAGFDTSVPDQCSASDVELVTQGPSACPAGSLLGKG